MSELQAQPAKPQYMPGSLVLLLQREMETRWRMLTAQAKQLFTHSTRKLSAYVNDLEACKSLQINLHWSRGFSRSKQQGGMWCALNSGVVSAAPKETETALHRPCHSLLKEANITSCCERPTMQCSCTMCKGNTQEPTI